MGISNNTRATYASARRQYSIFAGVTGCRSRLPFDAQSIVLWITWLFASDLAVSSIRTYLYGLSNWHAEQGHPSPLHTSPHVWQCWKGMKRWRGDGNKKARLPVTTKVLARIQLLMKMNSAYDRMMWAAYTLGAYGLLRLGEFTVRSDKEDRLLCWRHIDWFTPTGERLPLVSGKVQISAKVL